MYKWLPIVALLLVGCAPKIETRVVYEKLVIEHPSAPNEPISCPEPKYVLLEYKGETIVAESVKDKLDRLVCDRDKLRYTQELQNTIKYYEEVTK